MAHLFLEKQHCMGKYNTIPLQVMRERKSQYRASRSGGLRVAPVELTGTTLPSHKWNLQIMIKICQSTVFFDR
jgi:hypothetical protein